MMAAYADMMMSLPPQEAGVIALGRRPLAITAKEVEGTPAKPLSVGCPSLVEKSATDIDELRPSLRGDVRHALQRPHVPREPRSKNVPAPVVQRVQKVRNPSRHLTFE